MQPALVIVAAGLLGATIAVTLGQGRPPAADPARCAPAPDEVAALRGEVEQLREALRAPGSRSAPAALPAPAAAPPRVEITDAQVAAALARHAAGRGDATPAAARVVLDVEATFTELRGKNPWGNPGAWQKVTAAGAWDEVIARFARNEKELGTPQAQFELALALLARQQSDPQNYELSIEADKWFDRALQGDPRHWEARFTKAMCYTFWPDFLGKKPEAMRHFETLIAQQEEGPAQPRFAQTYVFLGNMHEARGDPEKARAVWARGARLFPQHEELRNKAK
jgi:hypothetical protein